MTRHDDKATTDHVVTSDAYLVDASCQGSSAGCYITLFLLSSFPE